MNSNKSFNPPVAKEIPVELRKHNHVRVDNYYWLREEYSEAINYLNAENEYTEQLMSTTLDLQEELYNEIVKKFRQTDLSVPYHSNGYYYYQKFEIGKSYPIHCRKKESLEHEEEVILDVNEIAKDIEYCKISELSVSDDNKILGFCMDGVGNGVYDIYFKNLDTNNLHSIIIPQTSGKFVWAGNNKTVFYVSLDDENLRADCVRRYNLNDSIENAERVFFESDDAYDVSIKRSKSKKYIIINSVSSTSSEISYLDAYTPYKNFKLFQEREDGHEYHIEHHHDNFFILTNWKAPYFQLMQVDRNRIDKDLWHDFIPHQDNILMSGVEVFKDFIAVEELHRGITKIRVKHLESGEEHYIDFHETDYSLHIGYGHDFNSLTLRYIYSSLTTPSSVYEYDMKERKSFLLKRQIVKDYDPQKYQSERLYVPTPSGQEIPVSLVYKKDSIKNKPLLLYGYGAYGVHIPSNFQVARLSLLDRGFTFAIAHVRGSGELGQEWHEQGKLLSKRNTFMDFIACAEHLINTGYTSSNKMFAYGESAGGTIIGTVINMRPNLFRGCIASVPFVDIVTTMLDKNVPLTSGEYDEWGDPDIKSHYEYMISYSPYDQIKSQAYPNLLVTTGIYDSHVKYWESVKWIAKLRKFKTDDNILALKVNMKGGHEGSSGRYEQLKNTAFEYAFLLHLLRHK